MHRIFAILLLFAAIGLASAGYPKKDVVTILATNLESATVDNYENANETEDVEEPDIDMKIVHGADAEPGDFPYTVSLRLWNQHFCGGSIIARNVILTAAHCITTGSSNINNMTVVTGTIYRTKGGESHKVSAMYYLKNYDGSRDLGIVKIADNIRFNDRQRSVALATTRPPANAYAVVSGWGGTTSTPPFMPADRQQYLNVKMLSPQDCRKEYSDITTEVCTVSTSDQGICSGDSGGPLVYKGEVVGVVSRAVLCAKGYPDVFASVYDNRDFILSIMRQIVN
ncbi:chymotrypsin-1-like [Colletes gigas]|uniref:chymotrypsin-1-like n=1 Tax=Colletes gigas TaxID=935657 RepID=UPI001C9B72EB|nr:chymotrypsin-1-like [Colletes gigas]